MALRTQYKSMQGKIIDMEKLSIQHELTPAVGNVRVNARGDELGPGGQIMRKREDIIAEYYDTNPDSVKDESPKRAPPAIAKEELPKTVEHEIKNDSVKNENSKRLKQDTVKNKMSTPTK